MEGDLLLSNKVLKILKKKSIKEEFLNAKPFPHIVINNFLKEEFAKKISETFPNYNEEYLHGYSNAIEEKKVTNDWNRFSKDIYKALLYLCSENFTSILRDISNSKSLQADSGLHGGGIHMHQKGGKLNPHLDYSIHPKLNMQRKLNVLIYLTTQWKKSWGGSLCFYENDNSKKAGKLIKKIDPLFNRAVIFDVTKNSWHGLPDPINYPSGVTRNSLAIYYLQKPDHLAKINRKKAQFVPAEWQLDDKNIEELCKKRSSIDSSNKVYITEED